MNKNFLTINHSCRGPDGYELFMVSGPDGYELFMVSGPDGYELFMVSGPDMSCLWVSGPDMSCLWGIHLQLRATEQSSFDIYTELGTHHL